MVTPVLPYEQCVVVRTFHPCGTTVLPSCRVHYLTIWNTVTCDTTSQTVYLAWKRRVFVRYCSTCRTRLPLPSILLRGTTATTTYQVLFSTFGECGACRSRCCDELQRHVVLRPNYTERILRRDGVIVRDHVLLVRHSRSPPTPAKPATRFFALLAAKCYSHGPLGQSSSYERPRMTGDCAADGATTAVGKRSMAAGSAL